MRNSHHLSSIRLSQGQKTTKGIFAKFSTLFLTVLMSVFYVGVQAQSVTVKENTKASVTTKSYDDCSSILEVTISPTDEYYFDFCITENNVKLSSSDVSLEGDASVFKFNEHNNIKWGDQGSYNGKTTTFYLNTRKGKPYIFTSTAPSLTDLYLGIRGEETINEGEKVNFEGIICPTSGSYTYQWYEDGKAISGETSTKLSYKPTSPTATFRLEASENGSVVKTATKSIQTLASTDKYTITPWWGVGSYDIKEVVGHCGSVYRLNLNFSDNEPQFAIKIDKVAVSEIDNNTSLSISQMSGGDGTPGWKVTSSGMSGKKMTLYIDARTTPIRLTNTIEEREFIVASVIQTKGKAAVERGELVSFAVDVCKNSSKEITYQWQSSTDGGSTWNNIDGGNTDKLEDFQVNTDKTKIRVVATNGSVTSNSLPVTLTFEPSTISLEIENAQKINSTEYEVLNHEAVKMTVIAERMSDAVVKVKVKDFSSSTWRDTTFGEGTEWTFEPKQNLVYRIQATGTLNNTNESGSITKEFILRIIHRCDENAATDTLWHDDFGHFADANTYITKDADGVEHEHSGSITDENSKSCTISNYISADPNFFVKRHDFAALDPLFGTFAGDCASDGYKHYACWEDCNGVRVEDGYYAILTNPNTSNCGKSDRDYWDGADHTGNKNGGMLFVNCSANSKNTIIYERDLTLSNECENVQLLFSAYISNAAIKVGQKPVNVRLDVLDENKNLIHSVASGDVMPRTSGEKWTNMTFRFKSTGQKKYTIQLTNNNEGGAENYGNDILLDDISITICYPNVSLITDHADRAKDTVETCQLDTVVNLYAYNENGIKTYIDEPVYLFQYKKNDQPDAKWQDIVSNGDGPNITSEDSIQIKLTKDDPRFFGTTSFRSIVASSKEILNEIINEENETGKISMTVDCDHVYAVDSAFVIIFDYSGPMGPDINTAGCIGETMTITGDATDKPSYRWEDADAEKDALISTDEKDLVFTIDGTKDLYHFYYIGTERLGCVDTQRVVVRKKENVWFDAPETFVICEFDSVVTLTDIVLKNAADGEKPTFKWSLNGVVDVAQTGSTFKIPSDAPLVGSIEVTGSAEGFCDSTKTIKYTIHKNYELSLDTNVDDDHLCFNNLNNTITLTAVVTPEVAMPSKFYWYSKGALVGESDGPKFDLTIEENGIYNFVVKSIDDICYKDSANAPAAVDTIWASRTADMKLVTTPENAIICEGESIKFALEIENALVEKDVNWKSYDVEKTTTTEEFKSDITITPAKSTKFTDKREMEISVFDDVCNKPIEVKAPYEVHNNIELSIDTIETYCLTAGDKITLNATVTAGEPKRYVWIEDETRLDSTTTNTASVLITKGSNNYSVIAIDSVCESKTSAVMTTEARLPITIDIEPKDTVFCEGTTVTFRANIVNALDSVSVPVIWSSVDLAKDTTIKGKSCTLAITPEKKDKLTETRSVTISTADDVCNESKPVTATTNYTIHNKMEIAILADRNDGLFCLTDKDGKDKIALKVDVTAGEPTQFAWYKDDKKIGEAGKTDTTVAITTGTNQYKVVASDGVCEEKSSVVVPIKARTQLGLDLEPKNAKICEGESIKLTATLTDALNQDITVLWEGDDIAEGSKTIGNPASYTAKTTKKDKVKQTSSATIKAHDDVCQRDTVVSVNYDVYMKIDIELLSDIPDSRLCMKGEDVAHMTIKVKRGNPSQFVWNDGTIKAGIDTTRKVNLVEGTNTFSVRAMDDVCNKKDESEAIANNSIETREPIKVDLFLDKSLVCIGNQIKATAAIKNSHSGSTSTITWSNNETKSKAANGEHSQKFKPSVGTQSINVSVADSKSDICPATTATALISAQDSLYLSIEPDQLTLCQREDTAQYIELTVGVTSGWPSSIVWSTGEKTSVDEKTKTTHIKVAPKKNTTYWAYGIDEICKNSDKVYTKEVKVSNKLKVDVELEKSEYQMGEEVVLVAHTSNDEYETIKWVNTETGEILGETSDKRFSFQLDEEAYGIFKYGVIVDNIYCGDIESGKRKITVADYTQIPNIITPYNQNGKNDVFMGPKDGKPGYKVEIYNRYQQLIYEGEDGWDGIYRGHLAEPGTYFYRIFMKDGRVFKGTLEVAKF